MSAFLMSMPPILASALALAYPVPLGQPVAPDSLTDPVGEIVGIEQDRAKRMTVPVSIEGNGPFSFVIDTGAERTVISRKVADNLALEDEEPASLMSIAGTSTVDMVFVPSLTLGRKSYGGLISPVLSAQHIGADGILGLDGLQDQRILFDFLANHCRVDYSDANLVFGDSVVRLRKRVGIKNLVHALG